jgi:23S rRNA pseudouridine955/2504/2580 synthase
LFQAAFVAMWPITGRTHQLRVHLAHLGTPLFGDRLYGNPEPEGMPVDELGKGLHLHARRLIIPHPRRGEIDVTAPLGTEMRKTWKWFGFDANAEADFSEA